MVHNGIEYGDMQLISEAFHLLQSGLGLGCDEMADVFYAGIYSVSNNSCFRYSMSGTKEN